jgi:hypothetical protein
VEGVGPVTTEQVRRWLGHCEVRVTPVLDLAGQQPVDGYEIPARMREAVVLRTSTDMFPYASGPSRNCQLDHTIPYMPMQEGGPPGQTRTTNLAPLGQRTHRIKTHSPGWRVWQVDEGVLVWRTPHGRYYAVDHAGTHPIPSGTARSRAPAQAPALN